MMAATATRRRRRKSTANKQHFQQLRAYSKPLDSITDCDRFAWLIDNLGDWNDPNEYDGTKFEQ